MHLRFDLLFERDSSAFENFLDMRPQLARLRVDNRKLLLDAESEDVVFGTHAGLNPLSKTIRCHPESLRQMPVRLGPRDLPIAERSHKPPSRDASPFVRSFACAQDDKTMGHQ